MGLLIVLLIIFLLLFGGRNLPNLSRGLEEFIRSFQNQDPDQLRRWLSQRWLLQREVLQNLNLDKLKNRILVFSLLSIGLPILIGLNQTGVVTGKQAFVLVAVLSVWFAAGYFCFGRGNRDE